MKRKSVISITMVLCMLFTLLSGIGVVYAEYVPSFEENFEAYSSAAEFKAAGYDLAETGNMSFPEIAPGNKALYIYKTASSNSNTVVNAKWDALSEGYVVVTTSFNKPSASSVRLQQIWNSAKNMRPCMIGLDSSGNMTIKCGDRDGMALAKISYNRWYQLATVMDMTNKKIYVYLDGQLLNPNGNTFYQNATDVGRLEIQTNDNQAGVLYVDNLYAESFSSLEDARLAVVARNIIYDSSYGEYADGVKAEFAVDAKAQIELLAAGSNEAATNELSGLIDNMLPEIRDAVFTENFEAYTEGASPSAGYVASSCNKVVTETVGEASTKVLELTNSGSRARLLKGGLGINGYAEVNYSFMQKTKSEISRLAGAYSGDGKLCAFEMYSNGSSVYIKKTLSNSVPPVSVINNYEVNRWYDISVKLDYSKHTATVFVDGERKATVDFIDNFIENTVVEGNNTYTYSNAPVARAFDTLTNTKGTYYIDNVSINAYIPLPDFSVAKSVFSDAEGNPCEKLTAGGSLDSVFVTKNNDASATLYTAVYEGEELVAVNFEDLSGYGEGTFEVPVNLEIGTDSGTVVKQFVWNDMAPVTVNTIRTADAQGAKVILLGDSTVASYDKAQYYPQAGWGEMLANYLEGDVSVENYAKPGYSLKATYSEKLLHDALAGAKPGDFMLIQFAHNDSKAESDVYSDAVSEYRAYLSAFVQMARAKGVIPVFVTSPVRRVNAYVGGNAILCSYAEAMKSVARGLYVPVIDLNSASEELVACLESEEVDSSKNLYLHLGANDSRYFGEGSQYTTSTYNNGSGVADNTHFCEYGADVMAGLVADGLKTIGFELSERVDAVTHIPVMP